MTCSRSWQIEAARDGRLTGEDLERVARHREHCADCAREYVELARLGKTLEHLPLLPRDAMTTHRERQQLTASLNQELLAPPRANLRWRVASGLMAVLTLASCWFIARRTDPAPIGAAAPVRSVIEVDAQPGAAWTQHCDAKTDRIDLTFGIARFRVHPHPGRRVLIRVPDGEVEDIGTVFEINVQEGQTRSVAVQEGRVSVRVDSRPQFDLDAGQAWRQPESPASPPSADVANSTSGPRPTAVSRRTTGKASHPSFPLSAAAASSKPENQDRANNTAAKAEDLAYVKIVTLLKQQKYAAAQLAAKEYLLQFPNGFRRVEVLNVAVRGAGGASDSD